MFPFIILLILIIVIVIVMVHGIGTVFGAAEIPGNVVSSYPVGTFSLLWATGPNGLGPKWVCQKGSSRYFRFRGDINNIWMDACTVQ